MTASALLQRDRASNSGTGLTGIPTTPTRRLTTKTSSATFICWPTRLPVCSWQPSPRGTWTGSENTAAGYIINRETLGVTRWDFSDSEAICFASEDLFLNFTNTALHLSSLSLGKQVARIRYEYAPYCSINAERTAMLYCDPSGVLRLIDISPFLATDSWRAPLFPGDFWKAPSFPAGIPSDDAAWPEWWRNADPRPAVPEGHIPNPRFGTTVFSLVVDQRCEGMSLTGVAGLNGETRDAFIDRGAEYKPGLLERVKSLIT